MGMSNNGRGTQKKFAHLRAHILEPPFPKSLVWVWVCVIVNIILYKFVVHYVGAASQLFNITACVGDSIMQNCTVESLNHVWTLGSGIAASLSPILTPDEAEVVEMGLTFRLVEAGSTAVLSSVSGTVTPELNNTVITCRNGLVPVDQMDMQEIIVTIIGK